MLHQVFTVLVVDDEPLNLELIAEHLDDSRFRLVRSVDGVQAWDSLDQLGSEIDAVVLDRMMPGMDGMELLGRIRRDPRFADLPVILQTAAAEKHQVIEGIRQGAFYYLAKPYDREILLSVVNAAIESRQHRKALRRRIDDAQEIFLRMESAEFSFSTLTEARQLATFFARLCPSPDATVIGLAELMINAVEHGNLAIGYAEKGRLNSVGGWSAEVERRMGLPEFRDRVATIGFVRSQSTLSFTISDQGEGFSWSDYLHMSPDRAFATHGRGIAMARMLAFHELLYRDGGRQVIATIPLS